MTRRLRKEVSKLSRSPPDGIKFIQNEEERLDEIHAEISGPVGTPFEGGFFRVKLVLTKDFPTSPPRGYFLTRIYHPNVATNGDICVNTLKKDWKADMEMSHILTVIRCLLIVPFPESSLNDEAGRLFMESYEEYERRAKLHTSVHATQSVAMCEAAGEGSDEAEGGAGTGKSTTAVSATDAGVDARGSTSTVGASVESGTPSKRVKGAATPKAKGKGDKKKSKKKKGGLNRL